MARILVLNGPNLNLLGTREPAVYGTDTLADVVARLERLAFTRGATVVAFQSNAEHELIDRVQHARRDSIDAIVFNPGAYSHTSIALRDALLAVAVPFYEVHLSNVYARESFRHHSYFSDVAAGVIVGLGPLGYELALEAALRRVAAHVVTPIAHVAQCILERGIAGFSALRNRLAIDAQLQLLPLPGHHHLCHAEAVAFLEGHAVDRNVNVHGTSPCWLFNKRW